MLTFIEFCAIVFEKKIFKVVCVKNTPKKLFQGLQLLHQIMNCFENLGIGLSYDAELYCPCQKFAKGNCFWVICKKTAFRPLCSIFTNGGHAFSWIKNPNSHFVQNTLSHFVHNTLRNNHVKFTTCPSNSFRGKDFWKFVHDNNRQTDTKWWHKLTWPLARWANKRWFWLKKFLVICTTKYLVFTIFKASWNFSFRDFGHTKVWQTDRQTDGTKTICSPTKLELLLTCLLPFSAGDTSAMTLLKASSKCLIEPAISLSVNN